MTTISAATILDVCRLLERRGVQFSAGDWHDYPLDAEDVVLFLLHTDQFWADRHGIDLQTYRAWKRYMRRDQGRCTGKTIKGARCRASGEFCCDPRQFQPGVTDRCPQHQPREPV